MDTIKANPSLAEKGWYPDCSDGSPCGKSPHPTGVSATEEDIMNPSALRDHNWGRGTKCGGGLYGNCEWRVGNKAVSFKLDTKAQVTVISDNAYKGLRVNSLKKHSKLLYASQALDVFKKFFAILSWGHRVSPSLPCTLPNRSGKP